MNEQIVHTNCIFFINFAIFITFFLFFFFEKKMYALLQSDCNRYAKVRGGRSSSKASHVKTSQGKSESEEYDTLGSDSDTEVGTSSRTESSNRLADSNHSANASAADARVHSTIFFNSIKV